MVSDSAKPPTPRRPAFSSPKTEARSSHSGFVLRVCIRPGIVETHLRCLIVITPTGHGPKGWVCLTSGDSECKLTDTGVRQWPGSGAVHAPSLSPLLADRLDLFR